MSDKASVSETVQDVLEYLALAGICVGIIGIAVVFWMLGA